MLRLGLIFVVVVLIALALGALFSDQLPGRGGQMSFVFYLTWMVLIGSAILATYRQRWSQAAKHALAWLLILIAIVTAYSYREEVRQVGMRVIGELVPGYAIETGSGEIMLRPARDGHFYVDAEIEGRDVRLMVDTGATMVALTPADARSIGLDPEALSFDRPVVTANGVSMTAATRLDRVAIGGIVERDVEAAVMRNGLATSLLGMSFLGRLEGVEFRRDRLILKN